MKLRIHQQLARRKRRLERRLTHLILDHKGWSIDETDQAKSSDPQRIIEYAGGKVSEVMADGSFGFIYNRTAALLFALL